MKKFCAFTLIELLIIIAIIVILAAFIIFNLGGSRSLAQDAVRKNDISNLYKSIVGKNALSESSYPDIVSTIEPGKTNSNLQSFIDQFLKTTPYDPNPTKAYLYKGDGKDFSIAAILDDGSCFIKSTGLNLFGSDTICSTYNEGGIGLVQNFMFLHGSTYLDLIWSIPTSLSSLPTSNVSSAIICLDSASELDPNSLPSDEYLFTHGTIVTLVNNAVNEYRITLDNPDYYYYCKTYSYDNTVITNPGVPGSSPNTSTGGFSSSSSSSYSSSSPSTYTPGASSNPPSIGGSTTTGGSTSPSFNLEPIRNPDGTGSITLSWIPGYLSTHTLIRRDYNTPPETRTDGTSIYYERNDKDSQDITSIHYHTDTGLSEDYIYCYSAWAYDERTNTYSNGFVLACGGVPPSSPTNLTMSSTTNSFNLSWTKGSSTNTVIRRSINIPPQNQEQGTLVYNSTSSSFTDTDITLTKNTTYCYSIWSYNPTTASLSTEYLSSCGTLSNMATPTNLSFPTVAYNSIILNWTPGTGSTNTLIVRKQGSIPTSRTDGTTIYEDNGNAFIDTGLTDNTEYCYALYATDNTEYTEALTGCQSTQTITGLVSHWKFDEGTGTTAYDSAGTNHGTLTNGPTWKTSADCVSGGCLQFDGSNDYVNVGNKSSLNPGSGQFTVSAWVRINQVVSDTGMVLSKGNSGNLGYGLWYNPNGSINSDYCNGSVRGNTTYGTGYNDDSWHFLVSVRGSDLRTYIYLDGFYTGSYSQVSSGSISPSNSFYIGQNLNSLQRFKGYVDDVRVYNRALSNEEIFALHSIGIHSYGISHGACGVSDGANFLVAPIEGLCAHGTPNAVSGVGPWTWICTGTSASVSCSANKSIDGECGTANKEFYTTVTSYGFSTFCSIGSSSPASPAFPTSGIPVSWQCSGVNGGNAVTCTASKSSSVCISGGGLTCVESVSGAYTINKYTLSGAVTGTSAWTPPAGVTQVEYLVVAGGGGGVDATAYQGIGGGGGGGFLNSSMGVVNTSYQVIVGAGGVKAKGFDSSFGEIVAIGGGLGAMGKGGNGGSGGGGGSQPSYEGGSGTAGQGNSGGAGTLIPNTGGGGGGAGGVGTSGTNQGWYVSYGGAGGVGKQSSITGTAVYYAGGGGGGLQNNSAGGGTGGLGGGGNGGMGTNGNDGTPNTGGGAGGGGAFYDETRISGKGGSGIVIIRYLTPQ
ncbi:hypothetical protein MNSC_10850 [Minisyncoccus archaeophilus]|uniref:LamG-like jellyroll fold domain-containing protein n=1 Tax=Minisyncoccus archaeiphilus TaxID=3238481 RepID=UPI00399CE4B4